MCLDIEIILKLEDISVRHEQLQIRFEIFPIRERSKNKLV